jgi:hypothetical protein
VYDRSVAGSRHCADEQEENAMSSEKRVGVVLVVVAAVLAVQPIWATYQGLSIEQHTTTMIGGNPYDVYRVYANFSDANDRLVVGFGSPSMGAMTVQTRNEDDSDFGDALFNTPGGVTAPSQLEIDANPAAQWDTFASIGVSIADQAPDGDLTSLTPGFGQIQGNNWSQNNAAWYVLPTIDHDNNPGTPEVPPPQTLASFAGDGNAALRVLMLQLTVVSGQNVRGTLNLGWFPPLGGGGGQIVIDEPFETFNSFTIPGPGAIALLVIGGVVGVGGRRRD